MAARESKFAVGSTSTELTDRPATKKRDWRAKFSPLQATISKPAYRRYERDLRGGDNSLAAVDPEMASRWHPTKNGDLTPRDVTPKSNKKVYWQCSIDVDHVWDATIKNVAQSTAKEACPFCAGKKTLAKYSLATRYPELAAEWHKELNSDISPFNVQPMSNKSVWWQCPYGHAYKMPIHQRVARGSGCPKDNLLVERFPCIAAQWHPTLNGNRKVEEIGCGSDFQATWICPKGHVYKAAVSNRAAGKGCSYCAGKLACNETCLQTLHPLVADMWHPTKNGKVTPADVTPGSGKRAHFVCSAGHEFSSVISSVVIARVERGTNSCMECYLQDKKANSGQTLKGRVLADKRNGAEHAAREAEDEQTARSRLKQKTVLDGD